MVTALIKSNFLGSIKSIYKVNYSYIYKYA